VEGFIVPSPSALQEAAEQFARRIGVVIVDRLGFGQDGTVFKTEPQSAIKIFGDQERYSRELTVYQRLRSRGVSTVRGHNVPQLLAWDHSLLAIQMTIVVPPFVLDFAGARLDRRPDFDDEVMNEWEQEKQELFGRRWRDVRLVIAHLAGMGIHLLDIHPGNIRFGDADE
jgi:hypothetical protein